MIKDITGVNELNATTKIRWSEKLPLGKYLPRHARKSARLQTLRLSRWTILAATSTKLKVINAR